MNLRGQTFEKVDIKVTRWMKNNGLRLLRLSIGIIFFWFGFLKYFEGLSPAEDIATKTIDTMTFGILSEKVILYGLATWEVLIGIGLIFKIFLKIGLRRP